MGETQDSFKKECNKLEAIVSVAAAVIAVIFFAIFITIFNTHFTG